MKREEGYSSVTVFILILFLSTILLGVVSFLRLFHLQYERLEAEYNSQKILSESVLNLVDILAEDPTPEADSSFDPVWEYLADRENDVIKLTLADISSRFNLNFVRTKMIEESLFKNLLTGGYSPEDLKLYRGEKGFFSDLHEGYGQFFEEEDIHSYFTSYSYANLNVTYEDSLKKLYEKRVSEAGSQAFLNSIQQLVSEKVMADESRLKDILGTEYDTLFPLINIKPIMNINFVDEKILKAVLNYPYGGEKHENGSTFFEVITAERSVFELDEKRIKELLAVEGDYLRMLEYLGSTTWFWRITAESEDLMLNVVICRLPGESPETEEQDYQIIEWNYSSPF